MQSINVAIFGIFATSAEAERAIDHLHTAEFPPDALSVLMLDADEARQFAVENHTKAAKGATAGLAAGGLTGGTLGLLAGLGALAIPGLGPLLAVGPLVAAMAGLSVGSALGSMVGALVGLGVPEFAAARYEEHVRAGRVLLSVHCDTPAQITRAEEALRVTGALDISSSDDHPGVANLEPA